MSVVADDVSAIRRTFLVVTFLRWLGSGLTTPVMVLLLTERGLDLAAVGVVFAVYGIVTTVSELPTGGLADSIGRRPVLVAAAIGFVAFDVGLVLGGGLAAFVVAAAFGGFGRALASGPLQSWFIDRARALDPHMALRPDLSRAGVVQGAALATGALTSTLITTVLGDGVGAVGLEVAALPIAAAVLVDTALTVTIMLTMREPGPGPRRGSFVRAVRDIPSVVVDGSRLTWSTTMLRRVLATNGTIGLAVVSIELLWQPRLADLVGSTSEAARIAGLLVAGYMLAATAGSALANRLPARMAERPGPGAAMILGGGVAGMIALSLAPGVGWLAAALMFVFAMVATSGVLRQELLHEWVPSERRATIVSISSLVGQGGNVVASLAIAPFAGMAGIPAAWLVAAAVLSVGALVISTTRLPTPLDATP